MSRAHTVSISIYGLGRGKGTELGLYLQSLEESVGVFLEAETRHCKIKINCQGLFAVEIPVSVRRAEGAGKGDCVESQMRSAATFVSLLWKIGHDTYFPSAGFWF